MVSSRIRRTAWQGDTSATATATAAVAAATVDG